MEKVTQVIEVISNFSEKNFFSLTANVSLLLTSNAVQYCRLSTRYRNYKLTLTESW